MSSVECLREFVNERLTAAAEEIFGVFKQTVVRYEEEIDRQRRLLAVVWKPEIKLHRIELPQQHVCKEEEILTDQQLHKQDMNSSQDQKDPEPPQIREEQEELCTSQEGEQLELKLIDNFTLVPAHKESDYQLLSNSSLVSESQNQKGGKHQHSRSSRNAESKPNKRQQKSRSERNEAKNPDLSEMHCDNGNGKKSLKCKTCGKDFKCKSKLTVHLRVHTGEKPYSCKIFGKDFSRSDLLTRHMRTHTVQKLDLAVSARKDSQEFLIW